MKRPAQNLLYLLPLAVALFSLLAHVTLDPIPAGSTLLFPTLPR